MQPGRLRGGVSGLGCSRLPLPLALECMPWQGEAMESMIPSMHQAIGPRPGIDACTTVKRDRLALCTLAGAIA